MGARVRIDRVKLISESAKKDISVSELAELTGLSRQTITSVRNGKSCSSDTAQKLSDGLGVPLEEMLVRRRKAMKPRYIEFNGKHPKDKKENRKYINHPKEDWVNYGASYSAEFIKIDIDDYDHKTEELDKPVRGRPRSEAVITILDSLGIQYNGIITGHGKHLFFRTPKEIERKNRINWYCPLGIVLEWHFPEKDDHIPLMVNGVERNFFKGSITNTEIDELPPFLYPIQRYKNKPFDLEFPKGDRTQKLGAYLFYLVNKKEFTADQAFEIVRLMNNYVFEDPIPDELLDAQILNEKTKKRLTENEKNNKLTHSAVAKELIEQFELITVNGEFYSYKNGVYKLFNDGKITNYLTANYPNVNSNFEREVLRHIRGLTFTEYPEEDGTVNVKNGILRFNENGTIKFEPHKKENISFKQFNANYDPEVKSQILDNTLNKVFQGKVEQIELFDQLLGYLLMNHVRYQKIFFFIGAPSTGKSTVLMLIQNFCGKENVSSIQLSDLNKTFGLSPIVNKTANIFPDLKKTKVLSSDVFKMLADGSPLTINVKYKSPFTYCFTGKLIFGTNNFPDFSKDMSGIERRAEFFGFDHVFKRGTDEFDPFIDQKLQSDECMSALLNKAITGYKALKENNGFESTEENKALLAEFVKENDNVVRWLLECEITEDYLLREPIRTDTGKGLYCEYRDFCWSVGEEPKAQKDFSRAINQKYNYTSKQKRFGKIGRFQMFQRKES